MLKVILHKSFSTSHHMFWSVWSCCWWKLLYFCFRSSVLLVCGLIYDLVYPMQDLRFVTQIMKVIQSSKMLVLTRAAWRNIPGDCILHSVSHSDGSFFMLCCVCLNAWLWHCWLKCIVRYNVEELLKCISFKKFYRKIKWIKVCRIWDFHSSDYEECHLLGCVLLVTANVTGLLILFILMMEAVHSSETSVLTRTRQCHIPEDGWISDICYKWCATGCHNVTLNQYHSVIMYLLHVSIQLDHHQSESQNRNNLSTQQCKEERSPHKTQHIQYT
jgi:hypothetical protein